MKRSTLVRPAAGFTMIEIALSLAIIGFALVAILGVLPIGLGVQKDNREETIIDQDAVVWMNAIRNGSVGYDDLTNYVISITNVVTTYTWKNNAPFPLETDTNSYLTNISYYNDNPMVPPYALTNGLHIIGLLTKPKYESVAGAGLGPMAGPIFGTNFLSNYVVATIRAISGSAVEKAPQDNPDILSGAFSYRMIVELTSCVPVNTNSIDLVFTNNLTKPQYLDRLHFTETVWNMQTNLHDLRLTFRWPLLPTGDLGNGRATFRSLIGGRIASTNDFYDRGVVTNYFIEPSVYASSQHGP